ncbi:MAG TPA: imidazoleglycerol-phosphate dehydratase HisB [Euryarchaeota archaeon]|nr:histidine biosynthesis bifunctional protein HisB [archaeon BMS3Bbin15]HDL14911.1 imidazoleglycerol-phosphate dehydratase HisB [Euryarchaeota archaeon]
MRQAKVERTTKETGIEVIINLDSTGKSTINSSFPFLNHLLDSFSRHGRFDIKINATGDNEHHIVEDIAIVLGRAFNKALGEKVGIERFGSAIIPMDDVLVLVAIDIGGRSYIVNNVKFRYKSVEGLSSEMIDHFIDTLAKEMKINLHAKLLAGKNEHHKAEALFKAMGVAMRKATRVTGDELPSTKGTL